MSNVGIGFCAAYLAATACCVFSSPSVDGDPKGRFVLLQLPIAAQLGVLGAIGFRPVLRQLSWPGAYALVVPPTLAGLHGFGWLLADVLRRGRGLPGS